MYGPAIIAVILVGVFSLAATIKIGLDQDKKKERYNGKRSIFTLTSLYALLFVVLIVGFVFYLWN